MPEQSFTFFKDNEPDRPFLLSSEILLTRFREWLLLKNRQPESDKTKYYAVDVIVRGFLLDTGEGGLSASYEEAQFPHIYALLGPIANTWKNS